MHTLHIFTIIPTASPAFFRIFFPLLRLSLKPTEKSEFWFLTPIVSRSQAGVHAEIQAFARKIDPKTPKAAHGSPQAPLLPKASDSAVDEPIRAVNAVISMIPLPRISWGVLAIWKERFHWNVMAKIQSLCRWG